MQKQTLYSEISLEIAPWRGSREGCKWVAKHTNGEQLKGRGLMTRLRSQSPTTDGAFLSSPPRLVILVAILQTAVFKASNIALSKKWWIHEEKWKLSNEANEMTIHGCHEYLAQLDFKPTCNDSTKRSYACRHYWMLGGVTPSYILHARALKTYLSEGYLPCRNDYKVWYFSI
jgi:hypothetical protein